MDEAVAPPLGVVIGPVVFTWLVKAGPAQAPSPGSPNAVFPNGNPLLLIAVAPVLNHSGVFAGNVVRPKAAGNIGSEQAVVPGAIVTVVAPDHKNRATPIGLSLSMAASITRLPGPTVSPAPPQLP